MSRAPRGLIFVHTSEEWSYHASYVYTFNKSENARWRATPRYFLLPEFLGRFL
jgi:hypothetical protein